MRSQVSDQVSDVTYSADEMMTVSAARALRDGMTCFVGIGLPSSAANLARATHAPSLVLIYESGTIGAKPGQLPLSIGDGMLAETADAVVSVPEIFNYMGVLEPDPETLEFTLTGLYPGVSASAAKERTGWDLAIAADREIIAAPTPAELTALRAFHGTRSHQ
jgi:acyl CoA:acetate/3-ketoacid CoA transferase beta subunit